MNMDTAMSKDDDQMSEADDQMLVEEYMEHERWVGAYATEKKIERLEAANNELLEALKTCCIATQGKKKAFCECFQHNSRPCLDMEGVCWFGKNGNCHIWKVIQKARGRDENHN